MKGEAGDSTQRVSPAHRRAGWEGSLCLLRMGEIEPPSTKSKETKHRKGRPCLSLPSRLLSVRISILWAGGRAGRKMEGISYVNVNHPV